MRLVGLIALGLLLCVPEQTRALTLFVDFNNAEGEIRAFQATRSGKPHEIVVLPSYERITPKQRVLARRANEKLEKFTQAAQDCAVSARPNASQCVQVYARIRKAELERVAETGDYTYQDLKAELLALTDKHPGLRFDMLVVSGHHEAGFYRGELSHATERELVEFVREGGAALSQVNTIVLLGCLTGSKESYVGYLSPLFPNAALIVGAEDWAPTRDEARNLAFIRRFNASRPALLQAKTPREIEPVYRGLLAEAWPVSLLWRNKVLFLRKGQELF